MGSGTANGERFGGTLSGQHGLLLREYLDTQAAQIMEAVSVGVKALQTNRYNCCLTFGL
jgi:hypothetical protein